MLYNINTCKWDQELLDLFNVNVSSLPSIISSKVRMPDVPPYSSITTAMLICSEMNL